MVATLPPLLQVAGHPIRWAILGELARSDLRVRELTSTLDERQSLVSYHLGRLRADGLVATRRSAFDGRDTYYRADLGRCRALFATHFHELTPLDRSLARVSNLTLKVQEHAGDVVFLHEVVPGVADRSYGLHVARLAGLPGEVVERARGVMAELEKGAARKGRRAEPVAELPLFAAAPPPPPAPKADPLREALAGLDPDGMTPREALDALYRIRGLV